MLLKIWMESYDLFPKKNLRILPAKKKVKDEKKFVHKSVNDNGRRGEKGGWEGSRGTLDERGRRGHDNRGNGKQLSVKNIWQNCFLC